MHVVLLRANTRVIFSIAKMVKNNAEESNNMANHPHNYYNSPPSTAWMATVADSVGLGLLTLVILARCYTKLRITKAPGWEDCMFEGQRETICLTFLLIVSDADTILVAYGFFIAMATLEYIHRFHYGGGRHSYDLPPEYYQGWFGVSPP